MRNLRKLLIFCPVFLFGCGNHSNTSTDNPAVMYKDTAAKPLSIVTDFRNAVLLDSSENVMFPLTNPNMAEDRGFKSTGQVSYWNIAFYNSLSKKYHLLDNRKMVILQYDEQSQFISSHNEYYSDNDINNASQSFSNEGKFICYSIIVDDFNKDGKLDYDDPKYLFMSDKAGNNFKQISPGNLNVVSWQRILKTNKLLIEIQLDSNGDRIFDNKDHIVPYVYDIKTGKPAEPIFSNEFNKATGELFEKQWSESKK